MIASYYGLGIRQRQPVAARRPAPNVGERFGRMRDANELLVNAPFKGITTDGNVVPGLFPLGATGVSTEPIRRAALDFLDVLRADQRQQASFDVAADAWRRWWNIHPFLMRHGLLLEDLSADQRAAAWRLVEQTLSASGATTARDIMRLNHTVGEITGSWTEYGELVYFVSLFGEPSATEPWGWQIDGHHLIVNCFVLGDQLVITPVFLGSEPVVAETGKYRGTAVLQTEQNDGLELINALTAPQRDQAILYHSILSTDLPPERGIGSDGRVQTAAFRDNMELPYEGIRADALTAGQRERLLRLTELYTGKLRPGHAEVWLDSVRQHLDETHFLWMGGTGPTDVFYYRIHSPVILIEFDHQPGIAFDTPEPTRAHIHTVVRTPNGNDYGRDYLRQHHQRVQHLNGQHVARVWLAHRPGLLRSPGRVGGLARQAAATLTIHDPGHVSLRRGVRAAFVVPLLLAAALRLDVGTGLATFLVFGALALLVLADFGGPTHPRLLAYAATAIIGGGLVLLGTLVSGTMWLAVAATALVSLAIAGSAVLGSYVAAAQTTLLLAFVLAVSTESEPAAIQPRLIGWTVAGIASTLAAWLLWPHSSHDALCAVASTVTQTLGRLVALAPDDAEPTARARLTGSARTMLARMRTGAVAARRRPSGATRRDRALAELANDLDRALEFTDVHPHGSVAPALDESHTLHRSIVDAFEATAGILRGTADRQPVEALAAARNAHREALDAWATTQLTAGVAPARVVDGLGAAHPLRLMAYVALTIAQDAEVALDLPVTGTTSAALRRGVRNVAREELATSSIWVHNSVRIALALSLATLAARWLAVPFAFWVVLGTLSALRGTALSTSRTALQGLIGTGLGVLIAVPVVALAGDPVVLWLLLPVVVFLAAYTPVAIHFLVGQVAFSMLVIVLFNILAPADWLLGLTRVGDVALGVAVSALVSLLLWPRGARGQLRSSLAALYTAAAQYLSASLGQMLDGSPTATAGLAELRERALTEAIRADEVFDGALVERAHLLPPLPVWTALLSGGKRLLQVAAVLDDLAARGYAATPDMAGGVTLRALAAGTLARVAWLATELERGSAGPLALTPDQPAARRAAVIDELTSASHGVDPHRYRSAIGLAAAANWLTQIDHLVDHLSEPAIQAGATAKARWSL